MNESQPSQTPMVTGTVAPVTVPASRWWQRTIMPLLLTVGGALLFTALILLIVGTSPLETFRLLISGAFSTPARLSDAVMLLAPLVLCSAGLSLTFAAGMYNLGVEGQMTLGAIFGLAVLRWFPELPAPLLWGLAFVVGALGGALWSQIVVVLKLAFRVSEIFAGLGLNFLATGFALYLVAGPWRKQGTAAVTGTDLIPDLLRLPTLDRLRLAPAAPVIALIALLVVWFALTRTHWGLSLRATGLNPAAAERLGVPANRRMAEALGSCGALAGVAGVLQIVAVHFALLANISGGIGLLALLVVLLIRSQPIWILPVALLFASFTIGAIQLPLALNIDSSIAGVLQGALVLFALVGQGLVRK